MTDAKLYVEVVFGSTGDLPPQAMSSMSPGASKPDPFAPQGSRMLSALDATPSHLMRERWPAAKVASQFAFRLEQMGTSLDVSMRNLERLCLALKAGQFRQFKLHALTTADLQKIAAAWGMVIDKAQAAELFKLRGLSPDEAVPAGVFVRTFIAPLDQAGGLLDSSRPRSHTRAPPIDYGGGDGPYSGGRANLVELARKDSYKSVGDRRRGDLQVRCLRDRSSRPTAASASARPAPCRTEFFARALTPTRVRDPPTPCRAPRVCRIHGRPAPRATCSASGRLAPTARSRAREARRATCSCCMSACSRAACSRPMSQSRRYAW
jgi:hypothetical protein